MSITKCPGHMRSLKLNLTLSVLTLGLKAKIFENLRLYQAKFWGELRTRATFDRCVTLTDCASLPFRIAGVDQDVRLSGLFFIRGG